MKAASLAEIKKELKTLPASELLGLCMRLSKYKKDNKELLSYLIFHSDDLQAYIMEVKEEMDGSFADMNKSNVYLAKKTIRKVLRIANKHIRYTGSKEAEIQLLLHFCLGLKSSNLPLNKSTVLLNLYNSQRKKICAAINDLHEDLQYEYQRELEQLA